MQILGIKQIVFFFLSSLVLFASYFIFTFYSVHFAHIPVFDYTEIWIKDVYQAKDIINDRVTTKQRLMVVGGSSSLFGFNGAMVELNTDFSFINYATHAGLPINYHIDKVIAKAKEGDIIILPLEFGYYSSNSPWSNYWYIQNMLNWDKDYRKYIDIKHTLLAYMKNNPTQVLLRAKYYLENPHFKREKSIQEITNQKMIVPLNDSIQKDIITIPCQSFAWAGYSYESLSPSGDFCSQKNINIFEKDESYFDIQIKVSPFFLSEYKRLKDFADSKNIKIFLFYPPTMENPSFSLKDIKTFEKIENLKSQLAAHNIYIYGDFTDFHFDKKYFYDTGYHLNSDGANLRTGIFIKQLFKLPIY
ncbi:hypothetical protein LS73_007680 [Helicobacter muridarum]|uniref:D-alanyl-lipoteichoic acid biosynthesis protein DltD n=1 Tax=Helicobacter muridarum TaxID=216 RepID=A0A099TZ18_9HELI|nr:hypothetical protein [Helicobacter muridarum]TLD99138.1 hypothetical protein LS73_007680 [Helicobacter muridarum]STQ86913.1 Uncharacterised protein [Helicobacter muridarum]